MFENKNRKIVYIIGGSNGCGKTTIAREVLALSENKNLEFLNADEIAKELNSENVEKVKLTAGKMFFVKFKEWVDAEKSFIVESTLSGKYLLKNIAYLKENGYKIILIYVFVDSADVAIFRVKERVKLGGHHIPEEDIRRRFKRTCQNFWNEYRLKVDEWRLVYNGEEIFKINEKAEIVARSSSWDKGECKIFNEHRFSKFMMEVGVKMKNENKFSDNKLKYYTESDEQWSAIFHRAISKAIENNRKHGVPNTYCRNGKIVFEMPDGTITDKNPFI